MTCTEIYIGGLFIGKSIGKKDIRYINFTFDTENEIHSNLLSRYDI